MVELGSRFSGFFSVELMLFCSQADYRHTAQVLTVCPQSCLTYRQDTIQLVSPSSSGTKGALVWKQSVANGTVLQQVLLCVYSLLALMPAGCWNSPDLNPISQHCGILPQMILLELGQLMDLYGCLLALSYQLVSLGVNLRTMYTSIRNQHY